MHDVVSGRRDEIEKAQRLAGTRNRRCEKVFPAKPAMLDGTLEQLVKPRLRVVLAGAPGSSRCLSSHL
jgi:hypothetical protein